jgi:hypothetical protein
MSKRNVLINLFELNFEEGLNITINTASVGARSSRSMKQADNDNTMCPKAVLAETVQHVDYNQQR